MTKKSAIEQAVKILGNDADYDCIVEKAMEIYAGAFSDWNYDEGWVRRIVNGKSIWFESYKKEAKAYTTSELIAEFEKID